MKQYTYVKLAFSGPLHLSRGKTEMDTADPILHSDKIKSAIAAAAFTLYGHWTQEEKEQFFRSFKVSSAFPYWKDEFYFPTPKVSLSHIDGVDEWKQGKKKKKIKYVDQSILEDILNDEQPKQYSKASVQCIKADYKDGEHFDKDLVISDQVLPEQPLLASEVILRVNVPRDRVNILVEDSGLYYQERLFFGDGVGLFFFIEFLEEGAKFEGAVLSAIQLLGDSGIGSDRTNGNGHFDFQASEHYGKIDIRTPNQASRQLLLSLYCPHEQDDLPGLLKKSSYHILKRGGYIAQPLRDSYLSYRKKSIHMFGEGSIFSHATSKGVYHDLKPDLVPVDHPIWRDGRPIFLPLK